MHPRYFLVASAALAAAPAFANQLAVEVTGISDVRGTLMVAVYDSSETFDGEGKPVAAKRAEVGAGTVVVTFDELAPGEHAVKLYHDANGNGELDRNMLGLPSEGYGFSNNGGRYGPPPFEEARFTVDGDTRISIRLR
ncbi:DUF2141 domain-containing protein [Pseudohaliea rubra]|mgnify:CR=1 FL=1|uniref:DUF2141 domain-containing protein n=1 Tax=Pseudohaliea rubra DSM 19751 TaxID=1265313 RepID=A0A095XSL9_9GAMM|nr:DUF2141 domain-containing protein [Pseudohaliea rubra]KGE02656.1 hypothetical protein HRUBRA_02794 [Pseudohaliea rubra DSM 19751]